MVEKNNLVVFAVALILLTTATSLVVAHGGNDNFAHHDMMNDSHGGEWVSVYGWIFTVGILLILGIVVLILIKQLQESK